MNSQENFDNIPLRHELDVEILMHRDVHFGGNFKVMLEYYENQGKGIRQEFEIEHIRKLANFELISGKNLAPMALSGADAEKIAQAKEAYKRLKELYEQEENLPSRFPLLIADLILSEEEEPQAEMEAIVKEQSAIVPSLLELLRAKDFYDPLFPGYGLAPTLAAKCLGKIGDKRAIITLFEAIGEEDFFSEDIVLEALKAIGEPAKKFLLQVVKAKPLTFDNERAAIALIHFKDDEEVGKTCLELLKDPQVIKDFALSTYLALACEGLRELPLQKEFLAIANDPTTPNPLSRDMKTVARSW